jgi:hypothetical protein
MNSYQIIFKYYKPDSAKDPGHINVTFRQVSGGTNIDQTFGMNATDGSTFGQQLDLSAGRDGSFGFENGFEYSSPNLAITRDVSQAIFNQLFADSIDRIGDVSNYNLIDNSCATYAQEMWDRSGQPGSLVGAFRDDPSAQIGNFFSPVLYSDFPPQLKAAAMLAAGLGIMVGAFFPPGFVFGFLLGTALASPLLRFIDPLTLDLDGDGIELTALGTAGQAGASTVFFDFDGDGFKERTGWVKADDGMLAIDLNGNGLIDNGGELFGQPARDGYEVLETYDTFADGVIDAKDAAFARLRIWRDLDQDGITDAGELSMAAQFPASGAA